MKMFLVFVCCFLLTFLVNKVRSNDEFYIETDIEENSFDVVELITDQEDEFIEEIEKEFNEDEQIQEDTELLTKEELLYDIQDRIETYHSENENYFYEELDFKLFPIQQNIEQTQEQVYKYQKPSNYYSDSLINTANFNYDNECGDVFKYEPNNKRDLIFYSIYYSSEELYDQHKNNVLFAQSINQKSIPNAKRILYLYGDPPGIDFLQTMDILGIEVIRAKEDISNPDKFNAAVHRFEAMYEYLLKHRNEYDRVVHSDFRDIIWFADGFQCFSSDDFFITSECQVAFGEKECNTFLASYINHEWMEGIYGKEIADELRNNQKIVMNVGLAFGGTEKMINYLEILIKEIHSKDNKRENWGFDQALINYLYYTNKLPNVKVIEPSQFVGFDIFSGLAYDSQKKALFIKGTTCSPIIRHKICDKPPLMCDP